MKAKESNISEPIYDDCMLEAIEQQQTEELITALVEYCKSLDVFCSKKQQLNTAIFSNSIVV